jgi:hypothetical protein
MQRRHARALPILVLLGSLIGTADAWATASTHIWAPSTDVQGYGSWHVTIDMYAAARTDAGGNHIPTVTNVGLTVGTLPWKTMKMEIGFDHKSGLGALDGYPMYGNIKLGVPENALGRGWPALAVGVYDVGTESGRTDYNVGYAKVARTISIGGADLGRCSAGFFRGNEELLLDSAGERDNRGPLAAWERTLGEISDRLWLCVEYMGSKSCYGCCNIGASWKVADNVSVLGGYEIFNNDDLVNTATLQVDIDL